MRNLGSRAQHSTEAQNDFQTIEREEKEDSKSASPDKTDIKQDYPKNFDTEKISDEKAIGETIGQQKKDAPEDTSTPLLPEECTKELEKDILAEKSSLEQKEKSEEEEIKTIQEKTVEEEDIWGSLLLRTTTKSEKLEQEDKIEAKKEDIQISSFSEEDIWTRSSSPPPKQITSVMKEITVEQEIDNTIQQETSIEDAEVQHTIKMEDTKETAETTPVEIKDKIQSQTVLVEDIWSEISSAVKEKEVIEETTDKEVTEKKDQALAGASVEEDIWGGRASPPLRYKSMTHEVSEVISDVLETQIQTDTTEETILEPQAQIVGKASEITEKEITGTIEPAETVEEDIWGGRTSPPLKLKEERTRIEFQETTAVIESEAVAEDIWTDIKIDSEEFKDQVETEITVEYEIWGGRTSPLIKTRTQESEEFIIVTEEDIKDESVEEKQISVIIKEAVTEEDERKFEHEVLSETVIEEDIWGGRTSPPERRSVKQEEFTEVDIKEYKDQMETEVVTEEDIWERRQSQTKSRGYDAEESFEITTELIKDDLKLITAEDDIWTKPASSLLDQSEAVAESKESKDLVESITYTTEDIWGGRDSPPLRAKSFAQKEVELEVDVSKETKETEVIKEEKTSVSPKITEGAQKPRAKDIQVIWESSSPSKVESKEEILTEQSKNRLEKDIAEEEGIWGGEIPLHLTTHIQMAEETTVVWRDEIKDDITDIWAERTSPPPKSKEQIEIDINSMEFEDKVTEETVVEDIWGGRTSPPITPKPVLEVVELDTEAFKNEKEIVVEKSILLTETSDHYDDVKTTENIRVTASDIDIWTEEVPSESLRQKENLTDFEKNEYKKMISSETFLEENIWGGKTTIKLDTEQPKQQIETETVGKIHKVEDSVGITPEETKDEMAPSSQEDIWAEITAPQVKQSEKITESETVQYTDEFKSEEVIEEDIWGGRTSPPLKSKRFVEEEDKYDSKKFKEEKQSDIITEEVWEGSTSLSQEVKVEKSTEVTVKETTVEDLWGGRTSPPLRTKEESKVTGIDIEESVDKAVTETITEEDIWGGRTSPPLKTKEDSKVTEIDIEESVDKAVTETITEEDIWGGRTSLPLKTKEDSKVTEIDIEESVDQAVTETITEEDIWGGRTSPPLKTKEDSKVTEIDIDKSVYRAVTETITEEDIWGGRTSPPLKTKEESKVTEEAIEKSVTKAVTETTIEEDIWGGRTSPPLRIKEESKVTEVDIEESVDKAVTETITEEDIWGGRTSPPLKTKEDSKVTEIDIDKSVDKAVTETITEEDIWGGRTSPPLKTKKDSKATEIDIDKSVDKAVTETTIEEDIWEGRTSPPLRIKEESKVTEIDIEESVDKAVTETITEEDIWGGRTSPSLKTKEDSRVTEIDIDKSVDKTVTETTTEEDIWGGRTSPPLKTKEESKVTEEAIEKSVTKAVTETTIEEDIWGGRTSPPLRIKEESKVTEINIEESVDKAVTETITEEDIWGGRTSPPLKTKEDSKVTEIDIEESVDKAVTETITEKDIWGGRTSPPLKTKEDSKVTEIDIDKSVDKAVTETTTEEDIWGGRTSPPLKTKEESKVTEIDIEESVDKALTETITEEDIWGGRTSPPLKTKEESKVTEGTIEKSVMKAVTETTIEEDIWGGRTSPPLRTKQESKATERDIEKLTEAAIEEDIWGGRTSPPLRTKEESKVTEIDIEESVDKAETVTTTEEDIWGGRTSPPLKTKEESKVTEEAIEKSVTKAVTETTTEEDIWEGRTSPPLRIKEESKVTEIDIEESVDKAVTETTTEEDIWGGRTSPPLRIKEESKVTEIDIEESVDKAVTETTTEEDIWGGRTSPPLRIKKESSVTEIDIEKSMDRVTTEVSIEDIWGGRTSPLQKPLTKSLEISTDYTGQETKEEVTLEADVDDIWHGRTSPLLRTKLMADSSILKENEITEMVIEEDIWGGRTSPPLRPKIEEPGVHEIKDTNIEEQTEIVEIEDIWGGRSSPLPRPKISTVEETELEKKEDIFSQIYVESSIEDQILRSEELLEEEPHHELPAKTETKEISHPTILKDDGQISDISSKSLPTKILKLHAEKQRRLGTADTKEAEVHEIKIHREEHEKEPIEDIWAGIIPVSGRKIESNIPAEEMLGKEIKDLSENSENRSPSPGRSKLKDIIEKEKDLVYESYSEIQYRSSDLQKSTIPYDEQIVIDLNKPELPAEESEPKEAFDIWRGRITPPLRRKMDTIEEVSSEISHEKSTNDEPQGDSWTLGTRSPSVYSQTSVESTETLKANDGYAKAEEYKNDISSKDSTLTERLSKEDENYFDIEEPLKSVSDQSSKTSVEEPVEEPVKKDLKEEESEVKLTTERKRGRKFASKTETKVKVKEEVKEPEPEIKEPEQEPKVEELKPEKKEPEVKETKPEKKEPEKKLEVKEPEPEKKEPEKKPEVRKREKKPEVKEPEKKTEVKEPEKKQEVKEPEKKPEEKKPEVKEPEKKPEVRKRERKPEVKEPEKKTEEKEPEKTPEVKEPEKKPEVRKRERKPEVKEPEKTTEEKEPEKTPEVKEPEKKPEVRKQERKPEVKEPEKKTEVKEPEKAPEVKEPEKKPKVEEPEKKPEVKEPEKKPEVKKPEKKPKVEEPEKKPEVKEPEKKPEVKDPEFKEPEKKKSERKSSLGQKSKTEDAKTLKEEEDFPPQTKETLEQPKPTEVPEEKAPTLEDKKEVKLGKEKFKTPKKTEQISEEKKEPKPSVSARTTKEAIMDSTTVEPSTPIVGLVDEDRPETQGRHAQTSVAAAWQAPGLGDKPVFTKSLVGDVVEPGEGTSFICEIQHPTQYYVTWLKDNKVLDDKLADRVLQQDEGKKHVLKLLHCQIEDSGVYTAKATDPRGSSSTSSAHLLVHELTEEEREIRIAEKKPFFLVKMRPTEVIENTNLSYAVHVKGDPMPAVSFFKDDKPLHEDDRVTIRRNEEQGKYELVIGHVKMSDAGTYRCLAMNKFDEAECEAVMSVVEEQITLQNLQGKGSLLKPGEEADFKWFRDGVEFDPVERFNVMFKDEEDTLALVFQNVTPDDAGIYTCVASTSCGKISCSAELTVEGSIKRLRKNPEPPFFMEELADTYVAMAGTAMLECRITGYPQPELYWSRTGVDVKLGGRVKQLWEDDENLTLIIKNITENDKGVYTLKAVNELGSAESSAKIIIRTVPKFRKFEKCVACSVGEPLNFVVEVDGEPLPELKWLKDGKEIVPSDHVKFESSPDGTFTMKIDSMTPSDCGPYTIVATNDMGQRAENFDIQADTVPVITRALDIESEKKVNTDHTFEVRAHGTPTPEATWYKDGKEISSEDRCKISRDGEFYMLKIRNLSRTDKGTYKIVVKNRNGEAQSEGLFLIRGPPEFLTALKHVYARENDRGVKMYCEFDANPRPSAKWFFGDKLIHEDSPGFTMKSTDTSSLLIIHDAIPDFVGEYTVEISNEYGDKQSKAKFRLNEMPQVLEPLKDVEFLEDEKSTFKCKVSGLYPPEVKWTKDGKCWSPDEDRVHLMKDGEQIYFLVFGQAKTEDSGHYVATFKNEEGSVSTEANIIVNTACGLDDDDMVETVSTILKSKRLVEVEKCEFLDELEDSEGGLLDDKSLPSIMPSSFIEIDDDTENVAYERRSSETKFRRLKEGVQTETPPHITGSNFREGKTFIAMHKFVLEVEATAVPEAEATWYLDGKELKEDDSIKFSYDGKVYTLERLGSDPEQTGEYKCKLKNKISEAEEVGVVTIIEKEARVRQSLQNVNVKENTDGTIQCQIVGDPMPSVEWFRNGKPITDSDRIVIKADLEKGIHSLTFKDVDEKDKSTFTLKGKNEHGDCESSCVMTIYVVPRPGELQDATVDWGKDLWLSVHIHAIPPPQMTWFKDGKEIAESDRVLYHRDEENENYSFEIKTTVLEDAATYTFKAVNAVGEATGRSIVKIHTEKPTIVTKIKSQDICLEDEVTFTVKCAGLPTPEIEWRNKDVLVNEAEKYTMVKRDNFTHSITLKNVDMDDYGTITVSAINLVGVATSSAQINQKKLPCEVLEGLDNVTKGGERDDIKLKVLIRGSPRPKFVWTKDGDEVEASANFKISFKKKSYCDATISLTIVKASAADSGQYRLRFYNELNEAQTETALVVRPIRKKPKISNVPEDLCVSEMQPGMFKCKVSGYPRPEVTWLKDGRVVKPTDILNTGMTADGEYFCEFKKVTPEDAGKYTIVAQNDEGKVECDVHLKVHPSPSKPKFLSGLKPTKVIAGYPCRMEVHLAGFPQPKVAWKKNGKPVEIDGNNVQEIITDDGRVILQIANATDADAGEYSVVASNDLGDNTSSAALSVLDHERKDGQPDGAPTFTEGLKDSSFDEGKTIKLPVSVRGGPVPDMKWYKDGKEIKLGDRVFFTYDGDKTFLEIHPCEGADSGMYKCVIENPSGKTETECEVTVRKCFERPSFTYLYPNQEQLPGKDAKFTIKVDGVPKPEITWYFNGKKLVPDGEKYRVRKDADGCTLFVHETHYKDSGTYKVVAKNKEGLAEHEANLRVADDVDPNRKVEAPNILKAIGDQELYEGYTAKFKAVVAGRPQPEFEWYRNGVKLFPNNRFIAEMDEDGLYRLTIKYVCQEDTGVYELRVWNEHGKASCKGKLICECISKEKRRPVGCEYKGFDKLRLTGAPIPIPDRPIISALSDRRCTLSWTPFMPPGPIIPVLYQVEMCECPEGDWITAYSGIRGCSVDLTSLCPKSDYKFRVRVENKYGVSEPSPYVTTYRNRLERDAISHEPFLEPEDDDIEFDGPFVPAGFRIDRSPSGNFFAAPRFLRLDHDTQYGMKNFSGHVKWIGYGYPTPKLRFYFKDDEIHFGPGSKYTYTQEPDGEIFLFVDNLTECDVGWYKCEAFNEYGESQQRIRMGLSEYPRVLQHLRETYIKSEGAGRIFCRISAYPPCDVTWFKDWHEIRPSMKLRPQFIEPDMYCLNMTGVSGMDTGLYSMAAVNVAGAVSSSCMVNVEENDTLYNWNAYHRGKEIGINIRRGTLEDHYDIGDELGRGTQGITYHCAERYSGRNFAAKSMWGTDHFKEWMHNEFEMMNFVNSCNRVVRLYDAYEGPKNMVLVMELCSGGELLHHITQQQYYTEYEVAHYVRQILEGIDYMHDRWIAHLGLNIGDIMMAIPNGTDIKMCDLSLARNIRLSKLRPLEYGMPEFVAPEIVKGESVSYTADMWAVGVISYLLLSGTSPFRGENDRETLTRIKNGELRFDVDAFAHLSEESKDFVAKLLQYQPQHRLDVKSALAHPWMKFAEKTPHDPYKISTDRLKTYYGKYKEWYLNASSRRWYRRRTLASAFTHPSKMVYPPGEVYTPPETPERQIMPAKHEDYKIPEHDLSYEIGVIKSDSHYQQGPDTYLLQLRDTDFPVRLRSYMNLTRERTPVEMFLGRDLGYDYEKIPVVHERRRFTDIMDEEIKDERRRSRTLMDKYTAGFYRSKQTTCSLELPKRVTQEVTSRYAIRDEAEAIKRESKDKSKAPFLREKPPTTAVTPDKDVTLTCIVTGSPEPVVQWFRNDIILGDTSRMTITNVGGKSQMSIKKVNDYDIGFYKIMARNDYGIATHRFRIVRAEIPGMCDPPELHSASGTQLLLKWAPPIDDGGAPIELYNLQIKAADDDEWMKINDSIPQELYLVEGLTPVRPYQFRLAARNIRGWGDFSVATGPIRTGSHSDPRLDMPVEQQLLQNKKLQVLQLPGARGEIRDHLDYSREIQNVPIKSGETAMLQMRKYELVNEISRGRFSRVMRCVRHDDQRAFSCKLLLRRDRGDAAKHEYEAAKSLRHERLITMYEAYELPEVTAFIMEYLAGPDILTFLANKLQYTEQHVSVAINQVLDGLSYLHWRGLCHLDIQPDNVIVTSPNTVDVKLGDFGTTQKVGHAGSKVEVNGHLEYIAPEVLFEQTAFPTSDIWSLGVLTYVLLTGESPFQGEEEEETLENIQCVRSKFETLGELASQEATRFILLIFKRDPNKRPTEEECREHRWLGENDYMVKKRERAVLSTTRLREYSTHYHKMRLRQSTDSNIFKSFMDQC